MDSGRTVVGSDIRKMVVGKGLGFLLLVFFVLEDFQITGGEYKDNSLFLKIFFFSK